VCIGKAAGCFGRPVDLSRISISASKGPRVRIPLFPPANLDGEREYGFDLIEETGLDRVHLIGNSLGGWLAAEIRIRDRSRFKSLVQLAPAGIRVKGVPCGDNFI
jgi:pimeloyl-ACP methyl ester carboxylesterase